MASAGPRAPAEGADGLDELEPPLLVDINITPLVDVVLVLLIVFMVGSSALVDAARHEGLSNAQLDLDLPTANAARSPAAAAPVLVLTLRANGEVARDGQVLTDTGLADVLRDARAEAAEPSVIVDADGSVPHRRVVEVLDAVQRAGLSHVGIGAETQSP